MGIHYHIRWSDSSLDWQAFPVKEDATKLAATIKKPGESYTIVGQDDGECDRCKAFKSQDPSGKRRG